MLPATVIRRLEALATISQQGKQINGLFRLMQESSHGFRPGRSPHTALETIKQEWQAVKWLIDMDLRSYFDPINHDLLMGLLQKRIGDSRFLHLIKAMLDAGYLEDWT